MKPESAESLKSLIENIFGPQSKGGCGDPNCKNCNGSRQMHEFDGTISAASVQKFNKLYARYQQLGGGVGIADMEEEEKRHMILNGIMDIMADTMTVKIDAVESAIKRADELGYPQVATAFRKVKELVLELKGMEHLLNSEMDDNLAAYQAEKASGGTSAEVPVSVG